MPLPSEVWELPSQCWIGVSMLTISAGLKINIKKKLVRSPTVSVPFVTKLITHVPGGLQSVIKKIRFV